MYDEEALNDDASIATRITRARTRGRLAAPRLRVTEQHIEWSFDKVLSVFDHEWQEWAEKRASRSRRLAVFGVHPFLTAMTTGSINATSAVMEMAAYISAFESDPAFGELAASLKSPNNFESSRFELAMAYRFSLTDAAVHLQPAVGQRRGDFEVIVGDYSWVCECARHQITAEEEKHRTFLHEIGERLRSIGESEITGVTLKVDVRRLGDARDCSRLVATVKDLIREWRQRPWRAHSKTNEFADVLVCAFCDADDPNPLHHGEASGWSMIFEVCRTSRSDFGRFMSHAAEDIEKEYESRVFIRAPMLPESDHLPGLVQRIRRKLSQISATGTSQFRIVFVEALGRETDYQSDKLKDALDAAVRKNRDIAGFGVMFRYFGKHSRYRYGGFIGTNEGCPMGIPPLLIDAFSAIEETGPYPIGRI